MSLDAEARLADLVSQNEHGSGITFKIKADPRNKGLSLDQRFGKVVAAMEAVYGETQLPDEYRRAANCFSGIGDGLGA